MIGPIVRQLRQERNLSQEALASSAHVSSGYLSKLERGVYKAPSGEVLSRIAGALSMQPDELYTLAGLDYLLNRDDPAFEPLLQSFAPLLADLPKRDHGIIIGELRRVLREEKAGAP